MAKQPPRGSAERSAREIILGDGIATLLFMIINSVWDEVGAQVCARRTGPEHVAPPTLLPSADCGYAGSCNRPNSTHRGFDGSYHWPHALLPFQRDGFWSRYGASILALIACYDNQFRCMTWLPQRVFHVQARPSTHLTTLPLQQREGAALLCTWGAWWAPTLQDKASVVRNIVVRLCAVKLTQKPWKKRGARVSANCGSFQSPLLLRCCD